MSNETEIPRRIRLDKMTPTELSITEAMRAVEMTGASDHLTRAVILLSQARDAVADHVDGVPVQFQGAGATMGAEEAYLKAAGWVWHCQGRGHGCGRWQHPSIDVNSVEGSSFFLGQAVAIQLGREKNAAAERERIAKLLEVRALSCDTYDAADALRAFAEELRRGGGG